LLSTATPQAYRRARERLERVQESNPLPTTSSSFNPRYTLTFQNTSAHFNLFQPIVSFWTSRVTFGERPRRRFLGYSRSSVPTLLGPSAGTCSASRVRDESQTERKPLKNPLVVI